MFSPEPFLFYSFHTCRLECEMWPGNCEPLINSAPGQIFLTLHVKGYILSTFCPGALDRGAEKDT
jgi:hypothetical protein